MLCPTLRVNQQNESSLISQLYMILAILLFSNMKLVCFVPRIAPVKFHVGFCGIHTQACTELLTRDFFETSTMMIPWTESPSTKWLCAKFLRPFASGLYRKLSKAKRDKIKKRLLKMNLKIVHQHVDADGRKRVHLFMQFLATKQFLCFYLSVS